MAGEVGVTKEVRPVSRGGWITSLALVVALAAAAGARYLVYRDRSEAATGAVTAAAQHASLEAVRADLARMGVDVAAQIEKQREAAAADHARLDAEIARLATQVSGQRPDERLWRRAELGYLLRVAERRARLDADRRGAEALLAEARATLASLDDSRLAGLDAMIETALQTLHGATDPDVGGLHARLSRLRMSVGELPLRMPHFEAAVPGQDTPGGQPSTAAEPGVVERSLERLGALFDFRRRDEATPDPLLGPDEERFLEMNLALLFAQAQVALLRGEPAVYRATLAECDALIERHFDPADGRVVDARAELATLRAAELASRLTDLSPLLAEFDRALAGESAPEPVARPAAEPWPAAAAPDAAPDGTADDAEPAAAEPAP